MCGSSPPSLPRLPPSLPTPAHWPSPTRQLLLLVSQLGRRRLQRPVALAAAAAATLCAPGAAARLGAQRVAACRQVGHCAPARVHLQSQALHLRRLTLRAGSVGCVGTSKVHGRQAGRPQACKAGRLWSSQWSWPWEPATQASTHAGVPLKPVVAHRQVIVHVSPPAQRAQHLALHPGPQALRRLAISEQERQVTGAVSAG